MERTWFAMLTILSEFSIRSLVRREGQQCQRTAMATADPASKCPDRLTCKSRRPGRGPRASSCLCPCGYGSRSGEAPASNNVRGEALEQEAERGDTQVHSLPMPPRNTSHLSDFRNRFGLEQGLGAADCLRGRLVRLATDPTHLGSLRFKRAWLLRAVADEGRQAPVFTRAGASDSLISAVSGRPD